MDVAIPFDSTRLPKGFAASSVQLYMAAQVSTTFAPLQTAVDSSAGLAHALTSHFTQFIPVANPNPVFISTAPALSSGTVGTPYAAPLAATGGTQPYTWTVSSGTALPQGITLDPSGALGGAPTSADVYAFFLAAADQAGHQVQQAFSMTVNPAQNPAPNLTSIAPSSAQQGAGDTMVALTGSNFVPASQVNFDGTSIATAYATSTSLGATIPAVSLTTAGDHTIIVVNPGPGGGTSSAITFTVTAAAQNPVPTIATVTPMTLPVSTIDTQISITGTNFISATSAAIGAQGISTNVLSATQLQATIPASYLSAPGTLSIDVYKPAARRRIQRGERRDHRERR
ncbi:MAG TPA: IPT/TIG domain-containing protein [Polyangiaceae bacterium]